MENGEELQPPSPQGEGRPQCEDCEGDELHKLFEPLVQLERAEAAATKERTLRLIDQFLAGEIQAEIDESFLDEMEGF